MEGRLDVLALQARLREFAHAREWERFHTPKNLAMALSAEAGELLEVFQWATDEQSRASSIDTSTLYAAREELADVLIYVLRLADVLGIDLDGAIQQKITSNEMKYPVELSKANAVKYNRR